jgi:hypothetical protein
LLLLGAGGLWLLAILGISWEPLGQIGTSELLVPALWFAALPAAGAWTQLFRLLSFVTGSRPRAALVICCLLGTLAFFGQNLVADWQQRCTQPPCFTLGLESDQQALVAAIKQETTPNARILWEDLGDKHSSPHWTALLPLLTDRHFIGGLDPQETIEHAKIGLNNHMLSGRPLDHWTDADLVGYCRRYNVGWILCRSPESADRFRAWSGLREVVKLSNDGSVVLFSVLQGPQGIAIEGKATVLHMDSHHVTLANVVPNSKGEVILSLHYQKGLQAAPGRVVVDGLDTGNSLPFVRLKLDRPADRVTITWQSNGWRLPNWD